jgi:DNA-binding transcriptional regulator WhiA
MRKKKQVEFLMLLVKILFFYSLKFMIKNKKKKDVVVLKELYIINEKLNVIATELELLKEFKN